MRNAGAMPSALDQTPNRSDVLSCDFLSGYNSCKWVYFLKVLSFAMQKTAVSDPLFSICSQVCIFGGHDVALQFAFPRARNICFSRSVEPFVQDLCPPPFAVSRCRSAPPALATANSQAEQVFTLAQ
jgi:hypothetical protein